MTGRRGVWADLAGRLETTVWPPLPEGGAWENGPPTPVVRRYTTEWVRWLEQPPRSPVGRHDTVDGVHVARFTGSGRVPLLMLHGWRP